MDKLHSFLVEWTINYVKNRDVIDRNIENIEEGKEGFDIVVRFKDKTQFFIVMPFIKDIEEVIKKLDVEKHISLVIFNSKNNFNAVVDNWKKFINFKYFNIYFVNPFSQLDKKWIIYPHTHNRICEESSLKLVLKSMFEMVEPIGEELASARVNLQ